MGVKAVKRENKIVSLLEDRGEVSVSQLVEALDVSEVTIRRDLESLEGKGVLLRTYGGAVRRRDNEIGNEFAYGEKEKRNILEKKAIAKAAAGFIKPGETVFLDSGTTAYEIALLIKRGKTELTVVTNSFPAASELADTDAVNIFLLGGFLRKKLYDFYSPFVRDEIAGLSFGTAFLGVDAISGKSGLTTTDLFTAQLEDAVMEKSHRVIIVADSSKIGKASLIGYGGNIAPEIPRILVTDGKAPEKELDEIKKNGFEIIIAET